MPPDLHPDVITLIKWLTSPTRPAGVPPAVSGIDALGLGDLWTAARSVSRITGQHPAPAHAESIATAIIRRAWNISPIFRGSACCDYLDMLAVREHAKRALGDSDPYFWPCEDAQFALVRCQDLTFEGLPASAARLLEATEGRGMTLDGLALARMVDEATTTAILDRLALRSADSPLAADELRMAARLDPAAIIRLADVVHPDSARHRESRPEISASLSHLPVYARFAEAGLRTALSRLRDIHAGDVAYASDKAFAQEECYVISRMARVALARDENWLPPVLDEIFRKVTLAPNAARTVPSQSLSILLGHAVEAMPTPEAVATLRTVLRDIRHAGVKKKLQQSLRGAERRLAERPEVALRVPHDQPLSKAHLTTLVRCLEAGLAIGLTLTYENWCVRLAQHVQIRPLATALVWTLVAAEGRVSVLPAVAKGEVVLYDVAGAPVAAAPGSSLTLWHPAEATAEEREAWRDRLAGLRLKQPFKQVFREYYLVPDEERPDTMTTMFSGHVVSVIPLLGLAKRERWSREIGHLARRFGPWTAQLWLADDIHPGWTGSTTLRDVSVHAVDSGKSEPVRLSAVPPATLSEILRAIDLLASTSGFALTLIEDDRADGYRPRDIRLDRMAAQRRLGGLLEMRRKALERAFRGVEAMAGLRFEGHHLRLGDYAVHLATARVTRNGAPVEIERPKPARRSGWLPHDDALLEAIYDAAVEVAIRG